MGFMFNIRLLSLIFLVLSTVFPAGTAAGEAGIPPAQVPDSTKLGVFSWQRENASNNEAAERMFETLVQVGASEVYQYMDSKASDYFFQRAKELQIAVYVLAGQPEWGLDTNAKQMINEVGFTAELMARMGGAGPAGLMLDVEPYLTKAYKKNREQTMEGFLEAMRKTYASAQEAGVPLVLCIPHFYDTKGHIDELNALIEEASDAVAVMNYQKKDESGQIQTEMDAARRAGKRLIHIYELQQPGLHDLTERNTYYLDGLPAVWDSRDKLQAAFGYDGMSFALHDLTALREVIGRE